MSAQAATRMVSLLALDPATYVPHEVHSAARVYGETNCYSDILIELLHARGDEPLAAMGFTVRVDFEGDQWTFFKPPPEDLEALYGIDVHEMQPYRPLPEQIEEQLARGRTLIVELDAFHLPDTAATSYRRAHVKSSAVMEAIDRAGERLRYFHNASLYELEGEDYRGVFRLDGLPPYTELVRFDAGPRLGGDDLREASRALLARHLGRRPRTNPFDRFGEQLAATLPALLAGDDDLYHAYAFATVRMAGSAFELAASHLEWLFGDEAGGAVEPLRRIVEGSKVLSFRLARRRPFDPAPLVGDLSRAWQAAMAAADDLVR
jgi:uncharacterized protein DUF1839